MLYHKVDHDHFRIMLRNLILFLSGALAGCILLRFWGLSFALSPSFYQESLRSGWSDVFLSVVQFLLLLYLAAYLPHGALFVPLFFGVQGAFLGITVGLVSGSMGIHGTISLILAFFFRLILVFPFGFILGTWAIRRSLRFGTVNKGQGLIILILLLTVSVGSAFLELSIARHFSSMYYLSFGV